MPSRDPPSQSIDPISEAEEDEPRLETHRTRAAAADGGPRRQEYFYESAMAATRATAERQRERDKARRSHRSGAPSSGGSSRTTAGKPRARPFTFKPSSYRREAPPPPPIPEETSTSGGASRPRHRRRRSRRSAGGDASSSSSSSSSSSDEERPVEEDHRAVLAASTIRNRLTSPSLVSTLTSMTTGTQHSGSSSGSNSTVTQASMSREVALRPPEGVPQAPMSPAVPDAPDVFAFLDQDQDQDDDASDGDDNDPTPHADDEPPEWLSEGLYELPSISGHLFSSSTALHESMSSSGSSSFHSDGGSSLDHHLADAHDVDTDRSTSPEHSMKGEDDPASVPSADGDGRLPVDPAASKLASQMLAAKHRQNLHQSLGSPPPSRAGSSVSSVSGGAASRAQLASGVMSPRPQPHIRPPPPPTHQHQHSRQHHYDEPIPIPTTGYDALAAQLSVSGSHPGTQSPPLRPLYRKFERLNHRLLLHLQDELAELEEQLQHLDAADTQSRTVFFGPNAGLVGAPGDGLGEVDRGDIRVLPASRRQAARRGGELEWHRAEIMQRLGFKLAQYNAALAAFGKVTASGLGLGLEPPGMEDVGRYRRAVRRGAWLVNEELGFLSEEVVGDLVTFGRGGVAGEEGAKKELSSAPALASDTIPCPAPNSISLVSRGAKSPLATPPPQPRVFRLLSLALAAAFLVPILTFAVIPGFLGRMTVVLLVGGGTVGVLAQGLCGGEGRLGMGGREYLSAALMYLGVMGVVAGVVG